MSPDRRFPPEDPREWLRRARSNLALAKNRAPEVYLEDLCFEAQQAAEKALKAVLIGRGIEFPYVHDLARLLSLLEEGGEAVPAAVRKAAMLTPYALMLRSGRSAFSAQWHRLANTRSALYLCSS